MRKTRLLLALPLSLLSVACSHTVTGPNARCSQLIPNTWNKPVDGAAVPDSVVLNDWMAAFVAQAGQLEKANGRTIDTIDIVTKCEDLVNASRDN